MVNRELSGKVSRLKNLFIPSASKALIEGPFDTPLRGYSG